MPYDIYNFCRWSANLLSFHDANSADDSRVCGGNRALREMIDLSGKCQQSDSRHSLEGKIASYKHIRSSEGGTIVMFHYRMRNERHASHATEICRGKLIRRDCYVRAGQLEVGRRSWLCDDDAFWARSRPFVTMWHSIQHVLKCNAGWKLFQRFHYMLVQKNSDFNKT